MSNLVDHARRELELAGMFDYDGKGDTFDAYNKMMAEAVLALVEVFAEQGHSGMSAGMVLGMFTEVANYRPLSPLTADPAEWQDVDFGMWQNRRRPDAFSKDGGQTYYLLDDPDTTIVAEAR